MEAEFSTSALFRLAAPQAVKETVGSASYDVALVTYPVSYPVIFADCRERD
jgi:hypothetical protein